MTEIFQTQVSGLIEGVNVASQSEKVELNEAEGTITVSDIRNESLKFKSQNEIIMTNSKKAHEPLQVILDNAKPIDFRKEAELGEKGTIQKKHYIVFVVDAIIRIVETIKLGLCLFQDNIYVYNNTYWERVEDERFMSFIGQCAEKMGVSYVDANYHENLDGFRKQFNVKSYYKKNKFKNTGVHINVLNGTLEIGSEAHILREFRAEDFLTYQLPFKYEPNAKCPLFMRYLNRVLPDQASQLVIAEFLGSAFIDNSVLKMEKALMPYGGGANGKSVLFDVVNDLLGDHNVSNFALDGLTESNGYNRAMITDKMLNYSSEISSKINPDRFKQMVSGEKMEARHPYGRPFLISQFPKFIVNVNELPRVTEHTVGYFRRILIIPFEQHIPEAEQDKQLAKKIIQAELSGVLNWILEGLQRLLKNKNYTYCEKSEKALMRYKLDADNVGMFLDESGYKPHPEFYELETPLYHDYVAFCQKDGYKSMSKASFRRRFESKGVKVQRLNEGGYKIYVSKIDNSKNPF